MPEARLNFVLPCRHRWSCPDSQPEACVDEIIRAVEIVQSLKETNSTYLVSKVRWLESASMTVSPFRDNSGLGGWDQIRMWL